MRLANLKSVIKYIHIIFKGKYSVRIIFIIICALTTLAFLQVSDLKNKISQKPIVLNFSNPEDDLSKLLLDRNGLTLEQARLFLEHYNFKYPPYDFENSDRDIGEHLIFFYLPDDKVEFELVWLGLIFHEKYGLCAILHQGSTRVNFNIIKVVKASSSPFFMSFNPECYSKEDFDADALRVKIGSLLSEQLSTHMSGFDINSIKR